MIPRGAALLAIDVQKGFDAPRWGPRNNPGAESTIAGLLKAWRSADWPVVHAQHVSESPVRRSGRGSPGSRSSRRRSPRKGSRCSRRA